jgi:hypothetical protein
MNNNNEGIYRISIPDYNSNESTTSSSQKILKNENYKEEIELIRTKIESEHKSNKPYRREYKTKLIQ